jgi:hypothetical protein
MPNYVQVGDGELACSLGAFVEVTAVRCHPPCDFNPPNSVVASCPSPLLHGNSCPVQAATGYEGANFNLSCSNGVLSPSWSALGYAPANCTDVTAPEYGSLGTCSSTMRSGQSCSFHCDDGYEVSRPQTSCALGVLYALQTCPPAPGQPDSPWSIVSLTISFENSPDAIAASDALQLRTAVDSKVLSGRSTVVPSDLQYSWRCLTQPSLSLVNPPVILSTANASSLTLRPNMLIADMTAQFEVTVTSRNPLHRSATNGRPQASARISIGVSTGVNLVVDAGDGVDPCATRSPCQNGGKCTSKPSASNPSKVEMSCVCPRSPYTFVGPLCSVGLLSCVGCVAPYIGGSLLTVYGLGLSMLTSVWVAGVSVDWSAPQWMLADNDATVAGILQAWGQPGVSELQKITFRAPAIHNRSAGIEAVAVATQGDFVGFDPLSSPLHNSLELSASSSSSIPPSYELLRLVSLPASSTAVVSLNYTRLVYYTSSLCLQPDTWMDDGKGGCLDCPTGATVSHTHICTHDVRQADRIIL